MVHARPSASARYDLGRWGSSRSGAGLATGTSTVRLGVGSGSIPLSGRSLDPIASIA